MKKIDEHDLKKKLFSFLVIANTVGNLIENIEFSSSLFYLNFIIGIIYLQVSIKPKKWGMVYMFYSIPKSLTIVIMIIQLGEYLFSSLNSKIND
ncbi:hypothetical protein A5844_000944 [Enterococcus sp. 10A9_DIV0425]|uniref:Uncharacterized protein n=2 Tax=Candidatus Enterococcus wittei TaxID=1987383 RepID=A0A242JZH7_9ENTE|nr:hypothetical protein A5844_000944 [Enterococcus sp. 10A9_DIV0425]